MSETYRIRLLAFASASDAVGGAEIDLDVPSAFRVGQLRPLLAARYPGLATLQSRLAIAVDGEIVGDDSPLREGSEVALLPPVSGG